MNTLKRAHKIVSLLSSVVMVLQPFLPVFQTVTPKVFAQEATSDPTITTDPTATPTDTVSPTPTDTIAPTATPDATPTDTLIPTEAVTPTPDITPTDTIIPTPTDTPVVSTTEPPHETSPPEHGDILPEAASTEAPASPTPTVAPQPVENGHLETSVVTHANADTLDLGSVDPSSATLTTDKADYAPTDTAIISGTGFLANHTYTLTISSDDPPATSTTVSITTDANGSFVYAYQLDGTYRPNYKVEIANLGGHVIATTTFTDSNPSADLDQWGNETPMGWQNGNLNGNQADYFEGDSVAYRMKFDNLSLTSHTVTIGWDTTKGGKHALDYLTSYDRTETTNPCSGISGCSGPAHTFPIPIDPNIPADANWTGVQIPGNFSLFGGTITGVSAYNLIASYTGDSETRITVTFTPTVANPVLAWGGHIATRSDWGTNNSAISISGSPYHMRLRGLDGSGGNQDRSLASEAVIYPATITVIKDAVPNSAQDFAFTTTGSELSNFSLDDDSDNTLSNTKVFTITAFTANNGDTKTITESAQNGWPLTNLTCNDANGNVNIGTRTATLSVTEGEVITCTFTNTQQAGAITVVKDAQPNDPQDFSFTTTGTGMSNFSLDDDADETLPGYKDFLSLTPGTYTVTEATTAGWTLASAICLDNASQQQVASGNGATINLAAGQNVTCRFTNTKNTGTIQVKKYVNDNSEWDFTISGPTDNTAWLGNAGTSNSFTSDTGDYTITETGHTPWDINNYTSQYSCYDQNNIVLTSGNGASASFTLATGKNVTCRFDNTLKGSVTARKFNDVDGNGVWDQGEPAISGWTLFLDEDEDRTLDNSEMSGTTDANGEVKFAVANGGYTACEVEQTGWTRTTPAASNCQAANVNYSENTTVDFGNQGTGKLTVVKVVSPSADPGTFDLNIDGTPYAEGVGDTGTTGKITLGVGTHVVTETAAVSTSLSDYDTQFSGACNADGYVTLALGDDVTCAITNTRKTGTITLEKIVSGSTEPASSWSFTINGDETTYHSGDEITLNTGTYTITESGPSGYTASVDGACSNIDGDTATLTVTENGGTCTFTNTRDTGSISGIKFEDVYNDEYYDEEDDNLLADWTIELYSDDDGSLGSLIDTTTTDEYGEYSFTTVPTGYYYVCEKNQDGWLQTLGGTLDGCYSVHISRNDQSFYMDFGNFELGSVSGRKFNDTDGNGTWDENEPALENWSFELQTYGEGWEDTGRTSVTDSNGNWSFDNLEYGRYRVVEENQDGWNPTTHTDGYSFWVESGDQRRNVNFGNHQNSLTIRKYAITDGEPEILGGASFRVCPEEGECFSITDNDERDANDSAGIIEILGLANDYYDVTETEAPPGYRIDQENSCYRSINADSTDVSCEFYNERSLNPILTITKENNAAGDQGPGGNVTFTITVTATQSSAYDVHVTDLPSQGFTYRPGSATAVSSVRGALAGALTHEYASPGIWSLGTMEVGETVTLTYITDISADQKPGTYKDLAMAYGCKTDAACTIGDEMSVVSMAVNPGYVNDTYVGTAVTVVREQQNGGTLNAHTGEVLGASTELPATGASELWLTLAGLLFVAGLGFITMGQYKRRIH